VARATVQALQKVGKRMAGRRVFRQLTENSQGRYRRDV